MLSRCDRGFCDARERRSPGGGRQRPRDRRISKESARPPRQFAGPLFSREAVRERDDNWPTERKLELTQGLEKESVATPYEFAEVRLA